MTKVFHPLLAPIASATESELAKYVQYLKEENRVLSTRRHLDHLVTESIEYYNTARSSLVRGYLRPVREAPEEIDALRFDQVEVKRHVGGLVASFGRKAA